VIDLVLTSRSTTENRENALGGKAKKRMRSLGKKAMKKAREMKELTGSKVGKIGKGKRKKGRGKK
jgi:hypothetical protein